jgi:hypothetical protein
MSEQSPSAYQRPAATGLTLLAFSYFAASTLGTGTATAGALAIWWFLACLVTGLAGTVFSLVAVHHWLWPEEDKPKRRDC